MVSSIQSTEIIQYAWLRGYGSLLFQMNMTTPHDHRPKCFFEVYSLKNRHRATAKCSTSPCHTATSTVHFHPSILPLPATKTDDPETQVTKFFAKTLRRHDVSHIRLPFETSSRTYLRYYPSYLSNFPLADDCTQHIHANPVPHLTIPRRRRLLSDPILSPRNTGRTYINHLHHHSQNPHPNNRLSLNAFPIYQITTF